MQDNLDKRERGQRGYDPRKRIADRYRFHGIKHGEYRPQPNDTEQTRAHKRNEHRQHRPSQTAQNARANFHNTAKEIGYAFIEQSCRSGVHCQAFYASFRARSNAVQGKQRVA